MISIQLVGIVAGLLTTVAFVPQVLKTWRSRSAKDLSLGMFSLLCAGVILWLVYGMATGDLPIILANGFTLMLSLTLLYFKFSFKD
jgi:MtN3 and saliva related transmembrane protein